eukprot:4560517-Pyramimonas_sp.AAC.1
MPTLRRVPGNPCMNQRFTFTTSARYSASSLYSHGVASTWSSADNSWAMRSISPHGGTQEK